MDSDQQEDPAVVTARIKRRLLMGGALFLAFGSILAGLLGVPWGIQVGLAGAAAFCVVNALRIRVPAETPRADETPRRDG
jgi:hypothetical protein